MEQQERQYEPFSLAPLRMRGVFGITWRIYKRGFFPMLLLSFVLVGLVALVSSLNYFSIFNDMGGMYGGDLNEAEALGFAVNLFSGMGVTGLLSLLSMLLLSPMYSGVAYSEYSRRMRGQVRSVGQLFRGCGKGLKRYYGTYWAQFLVQFGLSLAMTVVLWIVLIVTVMGMAFSIASSAITGNVEVGRIVFLILVIVAVSLLVATIAMMFLYFVFPVAVNENKRNFQAVGRSFRLVGKRFGRVLGASLLSELFYIVLLIACCLPGVLMLIPAVKAEAMGAMGSAMGVLMIGALIGSLLFSPYFIALSTVLYYDAAARDEKNPNPFNPEDPLPEDGAPGNNFNPGSADAGGQSSLYDAPAPGEGEGFHIPEDPFPEETDSHRQPPEGPADL